MTFCFCRLVSLILFLFALVVSSASAQQPSQVFALPEAHAGEGYRVELETVRYGLRLESGARNAVIQWALADGDLPAGMSMRTDGTIIGQPEVSRTDACRFRLRVIDVSVMLLDFALAVKPGRRRLSKIEGPMLVPIDMRTSGDSLPTMADGGSSARQFENATNEATVVSSVRPGRQTSGGSSTQNTGGTTTRTAAQTKTDATDTSVQEPFSSMNKRFIVGCEQTGTASSDSQSKPFFDLFINTPISQATTTMPARFSVWGDVRLTSTPEQVKAFADVTSNSIETITGGKLNQLGLGFDFVVGPEVRLKNFGHNDVSFISAFGAVSPLSPKQFAQIFQVPDPARR